jgi:hypothetical protein
MTSVCRPTPIVRFNHMGETWLKATHVSVGTTLEHGSILPPALYRGTHQNDIWLHLC